MNTADTWPAPAKLNLFLHITGRRDDGYHNLQTLFQFLEFGDCLQFQVRQDGEIHRQTTIAGVDPQQDLTVRAARLLQQHTGCAQGVDIRIEKNLPMGGGLGGGSSDAATTLVALNELWNLGLAQAELIDLGRSLGADVPIFIFGQSAWAEGIGEKLQAVDLPESWYVVLFPGVAVSTAELFADPELTRDARPIRIRDYFEGGTVNVFEPIVRRRYSAVNFALKWLSEQEIKSTHPPMMTGTGSCVFAAYDDEASATSVAQLAEQQPAGDWQVIVTRACKISPLLQKLKSGTGQR
ncbi:MAG: 4-(cytidine 5'-diphospho)-2-C-methyl-D-erythritol kinase [Gammaproteobacteria bacterium]